MELGHRYRSKPRIRAASRHRTFRNDVEEKPVGFDVSNAAAQLVLMVKRHERAATMVREASCLVPCNGAARDVRDDRLAGNAE